MKNNRCVLCGKIIPEGRQVCPNCEATGYKRLTFRHKSVVDGTEQIGYTEELVGCYRKEDMILNRLAELEDKIENGTLIELPCKVGDWLYYIHKNTIHKAKVEEISFGITKHGIKNEHITIFAYDFKNKVELSFYHKENVSHINENIITFVKTFFTKAEAKAKLKELQNERD